MTTTQKIVNKVINENIFPLKVSWLRQDVWLLGTTNYIKTPISYTKSFNICVSIRLAILAHVLNGYEIYFNATIWFHNMQDSRCYPCPSILDYFCLYIAGISTRLWDKGIIKLSVLNDPFSRSNSYNMSYSCLHVVDLYLRIFKADWTCSCSELLQGLHSSGDSLSSNMYGSLWCYRLRHWPCSVNSFTSYIVISCMPLNIRSFWNHS